MPEITIVITAYNLQAYLDQCLQEFMAQTFQDFDVLIVDDCSTDGTRRIIREWCKRCPDRIKALYLEKNLGMPAKTRNAALDSGLIDGRYFIFQDGDDSVEPQFLEKMHAALVENNADVAICAYERVELQSGHVLCQEMRGFPKTVDMPPNTDILAFVNTSPWNKLWRTEVFGEARFPPFKVGEEVAVQFTRYTQCRRIAFVDDVLIHYRVRKDSIISNTSRQDILPFAKELKTCYDQQNGVFRDTMGLMAFLHIGMSMALRAADNPQIDLKGHLRWTREYCSAGFGWFQGNPFLRLRSLAYHGVKGIALWCALLAYRMNAFELALRAFRFVTTKFHIDIKF